jgi:hypothetical protein
LKESIKIQIEHGIDTEVALYKQKLRGSEKTKKKLSKRLDEMESMLLLLVLATASKFPNEEYWLSSRIKPVSRTRQALLDHADRRFGPRTLTP